LNTQSISITPTVVWTEKDQELSARWQSENGSPAPKRIVIADDTMTADQAYHLACEGTALLWRSDFHNAKQLMQAMARRIDRKPRKLKPASMTEAFHLHRQAQAQRARTLGMLLIQVGADFSISLGRAPDVKEACREAYGKPSSPFVVSLRELLGIIGAYEWRKNGVEIPEIGARIYPHYGVFSPVRGEYLQLLEEAPLPQCDLAFDIGTGTGVIAALLAKRGIAKIIATELDQRALNCAKENIHKLGLTQRVEIQQKDMFPDGRASLIVCNPPWLPAKPNAAIEHAIYDPESRMLRSFLTGLSKHLNPNGEGWLVMSDFAEHLGLRTKNELMELIDQAGLYIAEKLDIKPQHSKSMDKTDPLFKARISETTSLWILKIRNQKPV